jgi:hypothetical protein
MIVAIPRVGPGLQILGLLVAVGAFMMNLLFGERYMAPYAIGILIAAGLDVVAIRTASIPRAAAASLAKVGVVIFASGVLIMGPGRLGAPAPLFASGVGLEILLWSCLPSVIGAVLRWADR